MNPAVRAVGTVGTGDSPSSGRTAAVVAAIDVLERTAPERAPVIIGELERVKAVLWARLMATSATGGQQESPSHRYVTQAEAAVTFNIPLSTVRYLTRRGRVPAIGRGKNRRLLPADLARELEECKRTGRPLRPSGRKKKPL